MALVGESFFSLGSMCYKWLLLFLTLVCRITRKTDCSQVGFFNTFFYNKPPSSGWDTIKNWTEEGKPVDVFSKKLIFVPSKLGVVVLACLFVIDVD